MFQSNRSQLRRFFLEAWQRYESKQALTPLEQQIVAVLHAHPEYRQFLQEDKLEQEFFPEQGMANPFLHMSLHLGLQEQINTNRPQGIAEVYQQLCQKMTQHDAEHKMMDCLAETLWQAQRENKIPDENKYLEKLRTLIK